jgi:hypothetical protein
MSKRTEWSNLYRYRVPFGAGMQGLLTAMLGRSVNRWHWQVNENDAILERGLQTGRDDAMSDATNCLNQRLSNYGPHRLIFNPENWTTEARTQSLSENMRKEPGGFAGKANRRKDTGFSSKAKSRVDRSRG